MEREDNAVLLENCRLLRHLAVKGFALLLFVRYACILRNKKYTKRTYQEDTRILYYKNNQRRRTPNGTRHLLQ